MSEKSVGAAHCWEIILSDITQNRGLLSEIEKLARENIQPSKIVFGTSGWRGEIGSDFTFQNIRVVTAAFIEMFKGSDRSVLDAIGVENFSEICKRGVIVGHDNRFLGKAFAMEVIGLLQQEGIRTWYAGEAPTPEFSSGIEMLNAACSINLTPSHNPANYAGFKFNPSDGGPAGPEITNKIEEIANTFMEKKVFPRSVMPENIQHVNLTDLYIQFITERKTLDIEKIRNFIEHEDCIICVDHVHGSTRGRIQRIIGSNSKVKLLRTENSYLFGGVAPEPSEENMKQIEEILGQDNSPFKLGVIMDPDGDRIRHTDGSMQIPMNYFGALGFHFLHLHKNIQGVVVKSVGTSNLVNAIAEKTDVPVYETKVGFKNFRPYMLKSSRKRAIIAFEESDGISAYNHTLEKDAIFGMLLAIEMMAVTGKNLSTYLEDIMAEYGHYYPDRSGIAVERKLAGEPLLKKLSSIREKYHRGTKLMIANQERTVRDVITVDGTKLIFDDGSWLMVRPSGTEPKVRFYIEARTEAEKEAVFEVARKMTEEALEMS